MARQVHKRRLRHFSWYISIYTQILIFKILKVLVVNRKRCFVGFKKVGLVYQIMGSTCMKHLFNILQLGDELKGSIFRRSKMLTSMFMIIYDYSFV